MSGMKEFSDVDAFLKHNPRGSSRGNKTLKGEWKKQTSQGGTIVVYLHPKALPVALWQHNFPMQVSFKKKDDKQEMVAYWSRRITCHDSEEVLVKQYYRNRDGSREHPAQDCPLCKLVEWTYQAVVRGELKYDDVLFSFSGATESKDNAVINTGPFAGITPKSRFLPDYIYADMKSSRLREAWSQKGGAAARYVLTCVNVADVGSGLQILAEGPSVGESIKKALKDRIHAIGDKGNFLKHPKPILITYDAITQIPMEKYRIEILDSDSAPLTPEIQALLQSPVPALGNEYQPYDIELLRAQLEMGAKVKIPFDELFGKRQVQTNANNYAHTNEESDEMDPTELIPCDNCGHQMLVSDNVCKNCGAVYDLEDEPAATPPAPVVNPNRRVGI